MPEKNTVKKTKSSSSRRVSTPVKKSSPTIDPLQSSGAMKAISGFGSQGRVLGLMVAALVGASFFLGYFYGQLTVLKSGNLPSNIAAAPGADPAYAPEDTGPLSDELWKKLLVDPAAAKGPDNADVTLVEFTDYQCPFCSRHFEQTDPQIQDNYVKTNKIKYITRDLPLPFHTNANAASQAARCAGDQNKYWEMHDKLFLSQEEWGVGDPTEMFTTYAGDLGMNSTTFNTCLTSEKYKEAVDADLALATEVGATGTPTFFINGKKVVGAQPFSAFETAIEAEL